MIEEVHFKISKGMVQKYVLSKGGIGSNRLKPARLPRLLASAQFSRYLAVLGFLSFSSVRFL